jgi:hypothetical protein
VCARHKSGWLVELYLENPCKYRPKTELYRRVSTSATYNLREKLGSKLIFFDKIMAPLTNYIFTDRII